MGYRSDVAIVAGKNLTGRFLKLKEEGVITPEKVRKLKYYDCHCFIWKYVRWASWYKDVEAVEYFLREVGHSDDPDDRYIFIRIGESDRDVERRWNIDDAVNEDLLSEFYPETSIEFPAFEEEKQEDTGITKERLISILIDYINHDLLDADPGYVRYILTDACRCTKEELQEIGVYDWLGFEEEDE